MPVSPPTDALVRALREQSLAALRELCRAFEHADRLAGGALFAGAEKDVSAGLICALMRMVVILFAEARGLLPMEDEPHANGHSLDRLRAALADEAARDGDTLGDRYEAWPRILGLFRLLHDGSSAASGLSIPARRGSLFDPGIYPFLEGYGREGAAERERPKIPDAAVLRVLDKLLVFGGERISYRELDVEHIGSVYEGLMGFEPGEQRRRLGAHYTSRALTEIMVERTLAPLLPEDARPEAILALRICDPAMGAGAFLVEVCRKLADHLVRAWERAGGAPEEGADEDSLRHARRLVAATCLRGVDKNPLAVDLARMSLWLVASARAEPFTFVDHALRRGDSLVGASRADIERFAPVGEDVASARAVGDAILATILGASDEKTRSRRLAELPAVVETWLAGGGAGELEAEARSLRKNHCPFHWELEFPEVFSVRGGFDAFVGNPPWVSYAGKAAQPLADDLRAYYTRTNPAFAGYRNLQGLFVRQCARLLRPGGRIGFVLPTSMSDLGGYEPSRRAHDELNTPDVELPDFGDAFDGVFQPSMGLLSTRREGPVAITKAGPWPLARRDLDAGAKALLDRLSALPRLPPHLFGERGFQSTGADVTHLHALAAPEGRFTAAVRVGGDIEPFLRKPPRLHCDPTDFGGRFRAEGQYRAVRLLIRQTSRFPMAALSDGRAFRNSILAGFSDETWSEFFLLPWLNSSPVRWFHYMSQRDARQGMPQMKIAHLRALPAPLAGAHVEAIEALGKSLGHRNEGIGADEQQRLDELAFEALGIGESERATVTRWAARPRP
jgi:hypothetical protein